MFQCLDLELPGAPQTFSWQVAVNWCVYAYVLMLCHLICSYQKDDLQPAVGWLSQSGSKRLLWKGLAHPWKNPVWDPIGWLPATSSNLFTINYVNIIIIIIIVWIMLLILTGNAVKLLQTHLARMLDTFDLHCLDLCMTLNSYVVSWVWRLNCSHGLASEHCVRWPGHWNI